MDLTKLLEEKRRKHAKRRADGPSGLSGPGDQAGGNPDISDDSAKKKRHLSENGVQKGHPSENSVQKGHPSENGVQKENDTQNGHDFTEPGRNAPKTQACSVAVSSDGPPTSGAATTARKDPCNSDRAPNSPRAAPMDPARAYGQSRGEKAANGPEPDSTPSLVPPGKDSPVGEMDPARAYGQSRGEKAANGPEPDSTPSLVPPGKGSPVGEAKCPGDNNNDSDRGGNDHAIKQEGYRTYLQREAEVPLRIQVADISEQNIPKLQLQVRKFLKDILEQWTLNEQNAAGASGRAKNGLLMETKKDMVKLLYKLRSGKLSEETVISLSTIAHYVQAAELLQANQAYLKLSIGNVAWPIGVRDVGIHARAADAKIAGDDKSQLANIMKSDSTRRWLIAVKRILTYCGELQAT